jgi:hypothetical protein
VIVPLAGALVVGVGLSWRSDGEKVDRTAESSAPLELRPAEGSRAMSLKVIAGPERAKRQRRPQNFPAWEIDPPKIAIAPQATEVATAPESAAPPTASAAAPAPPVVSVAPMSLFEDEELTPETPPPASGEAEKTSNDP